MNGAAAGPSRVVRIPRALQVLTVDEVRLRRELDVEASAALLLRVSALQVEVEARIGRGVRPRVRRTLVLVIEEIVNAIPLDRTAPRRGQLLVRVWQHERLATLVLLDEVGRVELVVAEVA